MQCAKPYSSLAGWRGYGACITWRHNDSGPVTSQKGIAAEDQQVFNDPLWKNERPVMRGLGESEAIIESDRANSCTLHVA